jgi:hypothetical protein
MKEFSQQFATQRLREEFDPNVSFTISDPEVDRVYDNLISLGKIENLASEKADYITLSDRDWNILQLTVPDDSIVLKKGIEFINSVHIIDEEGSVTGGEAFLPGLDVPEKVYKAGYTKKVKEQKDVEPKLAAGKSKNVMRGWQDAPSIPNRPSKGGFIYKQLFEELNESYSQFKNQTKTRGKSDQFHQAVREVRKKVQEINKLFEYVSRLKEELSEGEGGLKYKMHTEKALGKIKELVAELNQNIKKFK